MITFLLIKDFILKYKLLLLIVFGFLIYNALTRCPACDLSLNKSEMESIAFACEKRQPRMLKYEIGYVPKGFANKCRKELLKGLDKLEIYSTVEAQRDHRSDWLYNFSAPDPDLIPFAQKLVDKKEGK